MMPLFSEDELVTNGATRGPIGSHCDYKQNALYPIDIWEIVEYNSISKVNLINLDQNKSIKREYPGMILFEGLDLFWVRVTMVQRSEVIKKREESIADEESRLDGFEPVKAVDLKENNENT